MRWCALLLLLPATALAQPQPACGDGVVNDSAEECDDGNTVGGDGCSAECLLERPRAQAASVAAAAASASTSVPVSQPASAPTLDPDRAFHLSIAFTLFGPPGLGLIWGPSVGHIYAGESERAAMMMLLRSAALAGAVAPFFVDIEPENALTVSITSSLILSGLVIVDLLDGPRAVGRRLMLANPTP
jgi:cysteine-rich repeat protein